MPRSVKEWIGGTDDTPVPPRVRDRVLQRFKFCCGGCGRPITSGTAWCCDHIRALINGGANRENNLHPLCGWCRPIKDAEDVRQKSAAYARRAAHFGIRRSRHPFSGWRRFNGEPVRNPKRR